MLNSKMTKEYTVPIVLSHQQIQFETSQSWNKGHGPVSGDYGNSNGTHYPNNPYPDKKHPKPGEGPKPPNH